MKLGNNSIKIIGISMSAFALLAAGNISVSAQETENMISDETIAVEVMESTDSKVSTMEEITTEVEVTEESDESTHSNIDVVESLSHDAIPEIQNIDETSNNIEDSIGSDESDDVIDDETIGVDVDYGDNTRELKLGEEETGVGLISEPPLIDGTNDNHHEESMVESVEINTPTVTETVSNKTTIEIEQATQFMNETRANADEAQAEAYALEYEVATKLAYANELRQHAEAVHATAQTDEEIAEADRLRREANIAEVDFRNIQHQAQNAQANADALAAMAIEAEARYVALLVSQAEKNYPEPIPKEPGVVDVIELERQARDTLERAEEAIVVARDTLAYAEAITAEAEAFYMYARDTLYYAQTDEEMAQANQLLAEAEALKISAYSEQAVAQVAMAEADALYHYAIQLQAQLEETIRNNIKHEYYFEDYLHERYDTQVPVNGYYERYNITHKETFNHKTIYLPSADLEFGQQVVAEKGYDGYKVKHIINQYDAYTNQYIGERSVWSDSLNVKDRIILVGNALIVATNELPFETHYHGSEDLALEETEILNEGENTIENVISYYDIDYYTGEILNHLYSDRNIIYYNPQIIAVGNTIENTVEYISHNTIYIEDSNLQFGEQLVIQEGYDGEKHTNIHYDIDWQTGELLNTKSSGEWGIHPQDTIIAVGNRNSREETIEYARQYRGVSDLKYGEKRFVSPGRNGFAYYDEIYSVNSETGELVYIGDENTWGNSPVNEIVEIGTVETTIHQIPYNVIYIDDSTLDYRETLVVQEGKNGIIKQFNYYNVMPDGELVLEFSDYDEIPSIEKVIHIGTNLDGENNSPYRTYYANDPTLSFGSQNIAVEGIDGNPSIRQERQDQIIYVGSATESKKVQVPFETIYRVNNMLELGERNVIQQGVEGESESHSIYFVNQETGELTLRSVLASPIIEPTPMIVEIGNREIITYETPYRTLYTEDFSLPHGSVKVIQEGVDGVMQEMSHYFVDTITGETLNTQIGSKGGEIINSIDEIIAINPITKEIVETPFNTIYISNPNLSYGEQSIIQAGQNGRYITYSKNKLDSITGELYEVEFTYNEEFASVNQIIEVGTRLVERIENPVEVDYVADSQVAYGEYQVISPGENEIREVISEFEVNPATGELTLINEESINIATGKKQIVHVGNQRVEEKIIPYEITYIDNNDLLEGESKVIQAGKAGMVMVSAVSSVDSATGELSVLTVLEEIISNPILQIIERGTKVAELPDDSGEKGTEDENTSDEEAAKGNEDNKEDVDQPEDLNEEDEDSGNSDSSQIDDDKKVNHPDSNTNEVPKDVLPEESETTVEKTDDLEETSHDNIELEDLIDGYNDISVDKTVVLPATGETTSVLWTSLASLLGISGIGVLLKGKEKE